MEAAGIEPASADAPGRASTSLGCALISPGRPVRSRPTAGPAILRCRAAGDWLSLGAEPVSDAATDPRAEAGATRHLTGLGGECEIRIRTYVGSRCFTRPPGPRLAAQPENRPRRNQVAPVCFAGILARVRSARLTELQSTAVGSDAEQPIVVAGATAAIEPRVRSDPGLNRRLVQT